MTTITFKASRAPSNLAFRHVDDVNVWQRQGDARWYCYRSENWWGTPQWLLRTPTLVKVPAALSRIPALTLASAKPQSIDAAAESVIQAMSKRSVPVMLSHDVYDNRLGPVRLVLEEESELIIDCVGAGLGLNAHVAAFVEKMTPAYGWFATSRGRIVRTMAARRPDAVGHVAAVLMGRKLGESPDGKERFTV